jgi:hypothetical protein
LDQFFVSTLLVGGGEPQMLHGCWFHTKFKKQKDGNKKSEENFMSIALIIMRNFTVCCHMRSKEGF